MGEDYSLIANDGLQKDKIGISRPEKNKTSIPTFTIMTLFLFISISSFDHAFNPLSFRIICMGVVLYCTTW